MEENNVKDHLLIFSNLTEMNTTNGRKKNENLRSTSHMCIIAKELMKYDQI